MPGQSTARRVQELPINMATAEMWNPGKLRFWPGPTCLDTLSMRKCDRGHSQSILLSVITSREIRPMLNHGCRRILAVG